jgi:branched-chain amino acid aminotransferase
MLDTRGFVAETNATHLFMVSGSTLHTPRTVACPEGITRSTVLELCAELGLPCVVEDLSLTDFYRADECFCTGTMGELAPVSSIDGRPIGDGSRPMTARLQEAFRSLTERSGYPILG